MHNSKPNRPGSRYNADNQKRAIDPTFYPFIQFPKESPVQPGDRVDYMDEDAQQHTGSVLQDGAYLANNVIYVRVETDEFVDAVAVTALTKVFDYDALDSETRIVVQQKTGEIKTLMRRAAQDIIDIGTKLIEVKAKLGHGSFGKWVSAEFDWSESSALKMMQVATAFKSVTVTDLKIGAKALYLLAAPSTPEEARQEAIQRAEAGEPITHSTAKTIVAQHKPEPPRQPMPESTTKAYEQAAQTFEPPVKPPPVTYGKVEDDFQDDVPSVDVEDDSPEAPIVEPETVSSTEPTVFQIGDEVATTLGRSGGKVWNHLPDKGVYVKFEGSPASWFEPDRLVLVKRAEKMSPGELVKQAARFEAERQRRAASKEQSQQRRLAKNAKPADWKKQTAWYVKEGDLLEASAEIADGSIDIIITDPPYGIAYLELYSKLSTLAARVLKPGGSVICMTGQICLPDVMRALGECLNYHWTLSYLTQGGQSPQIWPRKINTFWKPLLWYVKGEYDGDWAGDVVRSSSIGDDKAFHEWGQSVDGFADIIHRFTYPNDLILDPFMGAGTTGLAALQQYRRFIGIDIDKESVLTAAKRLNTVSLREVANG